MPQLQDPNFLRSVMMIVQHDEDGTFGLVLNRPTDMSASDLCSGLDMKWGGDPEQPLHWGGPVQPQTGWLLFSGPAPFESDDDIKAVGDGMRFAGSLDVLRQVAQDPPDTLQVLLGYAGWGPGQLENELTEGAWLLAPVSREVVFDVDRTVMWEHVVRSLGIEPSTLVASRGIH